MVVIEDGTRGWDGMGWDVRGCEKDGNGRRSGTFLASLYLK